MNKIPVLVNGAFGKMGQIACQTLRSHPEFDLVAELGRGDDLAAALKKHQSPLVVDLTRADCVFHHTKTIIEHGARPVIGTSGLNREQIQILQDLCQTMHSGGIIVPNFSISAVLMMRFSKLAARYLGDVEIIERHHPQKVDAPSGTAMKTAAMIQEARDIHVPIHSIRLPGYLASQEVIFGSQGETLTIVHQTIDRSSFMPGLILACQKAQTLDGLVYGLEQVLD